MGRKKETVVTAENIGAVIKAAREEKGIRQEDLCAKVGISEVTLRRLENNYANSQSFVSIYKVLMELGLKIIVR